MKKRVLATALAAAMAGSMLAGFTTQAEDLGDPVTLTVTLTAVSTDTHAQAMQEFKKTVEELSACSQDLQHRQKIWAIRLH